MFGASCRSSEPNNISPIAPRSPTNIPNTFFPEIFSLIQRADKINTIIGVVVISTALFIGVDSDSPLKKTSMLRPIPKMAQTTILR